MTDFWAKSVSNRPIQSRQQRWCIRAMWMHGGRAWRKQSGAMNSSFDRDVVDIEVAGWPAPRRPWAAWPSPAMLEVGRFRAGKVAPAPELPRGLARASLSQPRCCSTAHTHCHQAWRWCPKATSHRKKHSIRASSGQIDSLLPSGYVQRLSLRVPRLTNGPSNSRRQPPPNTQGAIDQDSVMGQE